MEEFLFEKRYAYRKEMRAKSGSFVCQCTCPYCHGREVDLGLDGLMHEFDYLNRANYQKVFYDPASMVESEWQIANGAK